MSDKKYEIYQLEYNDESLRDYRFEGLDRLKKMGLSVDSDNYVQVYEAENKENYSLEEKTEIAEQQKIAEYKYQPNPVELFKQKTEENYNQIGDITIEDIESTAYAFVQSVLDDYNVGGRVVDVALSGSRSRGIETANSDIDVVVEYSGDVKEDSLFNELHADGLRLGGFTVDINPIRAEETGTLEQYLPRAEEYLEEKAQQQTMEVTFFVTECSEFPNIGEYREGIKTAEEAIDIYNRIAPERLHGIPSIGINLHEKGTEEYLDDQVDLIVGRKIDMDAVSYIPYGINHIEL